jgi:hypothetical protein
MAKGALDVETISHDDLFDAFRTLIEIKGSSELNAIEEF